MPDGVGTGQVLFGPDGITARVPTASGGRWVAPPSHRPLSLHQAAWRSRAHRSPHVI